MLPLERTILRELFASKAYAERVVPYIREEYFPTGEAQAIYRVFNAFYQKFLTVPSFAAIRVALDSLKSFTETEARSAQESLKEVEAEAALDNTQNDWLLEQTEEFCQEKALYCALKESIKLADASPEAPIGKGAIPELLKNALSVSFDNHVGHDYFEDADSRWDFYHKPESRIPFDLSVFNKMTKGGIPKKTLNVVMAGTNVGKSLFLTHCAAAHLGFGKNVLYITMEMAEEWIAARIDANRMNIPLDDVEMLSRSDYVRKILNLRKVSPGRLIIKEYPTASAHAGHFRALIQELRLKQNFIPDVVMIDYLTICSSQRIKMGASVNSYTLYKFVSEELRGLAVEFDVPVFTAAQFNRQGFGSSDADITNVGESWAIPQTADFMFALVQTEELEKLGQIAVQPMKNRYQKKKTYQQELLGIDTDRMKLYDLTAAQLAAGQAAPAPGTNGNAPSHNPSAGTFNRKRRPLAHLKKDAADTD